MAFIWKPATQPKNQVPSTKNTPHIKEPAAAFGASWPQRSPRRAKVRLLQGAAELLEGLGKISLPQGRRRLVTRAPILSLCRSVKRSLTHALWGGQGLFSTVRPSGFIDQKGKMKANMSAATFPVNKLESTPRTFPATRVVS